MSSSSVKLGEVTYPTVEHAFQAAKTTDPTERAKILAAKTAAEAKKIGKTVTLRKNWNQMREEVMEKALRAKFEQNPELKKKLIDTGDVDLIEGNDWGDTFWGQVDGKGENKLGKLLMKIRLEYTDIKEPKIMPNGKEISVQEQRKLIVESARIKGEQIKKLEKRVPAAKSEPAVGSVVRWNKLTTAEQADAVYIGRGAGDKGKFGNPFPVGGGVTVKESVNKYRSYLFDKIKSDPEYAKDLYALKGKKLACPGSEPNDACHGAVILKAIKYLEENPDLMKGN